MKAPEKVPYPVLRSIVKHARRSAEHPEDARRYARELAETVVKWDSLNGCYGFRFGVMYIGIEPDGYMHT